MSQCNKFFKNVCLLDLPGQVTFKLTCPAQKVPDKTGPGGQAVILHTWYMLTTYYVGTPSEQ